MTRNLTIPVASWRAIDIAFPEQNLSPAEWTVLMSVLDAMRPALVDEPTPPTSEHEQPALDPPDWALVAAALRYPGDPPSWWHGSAGDWAGKLGQLAGVIDAVIDPIGSEGSPDESRA